MIRFALALTLGAMYVAAQSSSLTGVITDPHGASIPTAVVTAKNVDTSATRSTIANSFGEYELVQVPPGKYSVTIEKAELSHARDSGGAADQHAIDAERQAGGRLGQRSGQRYCGGVGGQH